MKDKGWTEFEKLVATLHEQLAPDAEVKHNTKVTGLSGRRRQIDVAIRKRIGLYKTLIAIECKRYARPVGIDKVEAFATKLEDIKASHRVMVALSGFDEGAQAIARRKNITTLSYREANELDWRQLTNSESTIKFIVFNIPSVNFSIQYDGVGPPCITSETEIYMNDGFLFSTLKQFGEQIMKNMGGQFAPGGFKMEIIPVEVLCLKHEDSLVKIKSMIVTGEMEWEEYPVTVKFGQGHILENATDNTIAFQQIITEPLDMVEIRQSGPTRKIDREESVVATGSGRLFRMNVSLNEIRFMKIVLTKKQEG